MGLTCGITGAAFAVAGAWIADLVNAHYLMLFTAGLLAFSGVSIIRSARAVAPAELPPAGPEGDLAEVVEPLELHGHEHPRARAGAEVAAPVSPVESLEPVEPVESVEPAGSTGPDGEIVRATGNVGWLALVGGGAGLLAGLLGVGGGIVLVPTFTGVLKLPMKVAVGSSLVAVAIFSVPALVTHAVLGHISWHFALPLVLGVVPGAQVGARLNMGSSDVLMRRLFGAMVLVLAVVYGASEIRALR